MADQAQQPITQKQFTIEEEIAELKREIGLRHGFYKKKVDAGQMKQEEADYRIGVMMSAMNRLKGIKYVFSNIQNPY